MLDSLFRGVFDSDITVVIRVTDFLLCLGCSLLLGLAMAFAYMFRTRYTKSFVVTLALLPAVVCVGILLVNGNVGTASRSRARSAWCASAPCRARPRRSPRSSSPWAQGSSPAWGTWAMPCSLRW